MMNSSNGFGRSMGNSNGFNGFRPGLRPSSGLLKKQPQQATTEFLRIVDISQAEPAISAVIRADIQAIQKQMNQLDTDNSLKQAAEGKFFKGYVTALRKWLRNGSNPKEEDAAKVLKQLGEQTYEGGFKKLWKITASLDMLFSKLTQLQIMNFLIYDQMFDQVSSDSESNIGILSNIAKNGYNSYTVPITQVILDRLKGLFSAAKQGGSTLRREESKGREETNELIAQLKSENSKLTALLEQLSAERESEKKRQLQREKENTRAKDVKQTTVLTEHTSPKATLNEIEEKYQDQLRYLTSEKARAEENVVEMKVKIAALESQVKADAELFKKPSGPAPKSGSYEQALMEQMDKMKKGFERKIAVLTQEFSNRERDLRKKQAEYKSENEKIKWQKSLLLKKFELIPQK